MALAVEENAMALLDSSGFRSPADLRDDRAAFLEAVRSACLSAAAPSTPTWRMFDAVFQILRESNSLELASNSFQLLLELDCRYPRTSSINPSGACDLVAIKEVWLPFIFNSNAQSDTMNASKKLDQLYDFSKFSRLIQDMDLFITDAESGVGIKVVEHMLVFQYLVTVLEKDFEHRHRLCKATGSLNWSLLRESILNMLLGSGSRKAVYKPFVKGCISLLLNLWDNQEMNVQKMRCAKAEGSNLSLAFAVCEHERRVFSSVNRLLVLVMELDLLRQQADAQWLTSRADGLRDSCLQIILDELMYNTDYVSPFLMAFSEPKWKMEIILQYFSKYCVKSSVRTRRADEASCPLTLSCILGFFATPMNIKSFLKKMPLEVALLLLAHAYQVSLSHFPNETDVTNQLGGDLLHISDAFLSAFQNARNCDMEVDLSTFEREALFAAAMVAAKGKQMNDDPALL